MAPLAGFVHEEDGPPTLGQTLPRWRGVVPPSSWAGPTAKVFAATRSANARFCRVGRAPGQVRSCRLGRIVRPRIDGIPRVDGPQRHRLRGRDRDRDHQSIARGTTLYRPLRGGEKIAPVDQPWSCLSHLQRPALISTPGTTASATQSWHRPTGSQVTVRAVNGARTSRPALPRSGESPRSGDDQSPAW
jgi:hypothetical protein